MYLLSCQELVSEKAHFTQNQTIPLMVAVTGGNSLSVLVPQHFV